MSLAEQFAGTNETLHALIEDSKASGQALRGAVGGPKLRCARLRAYTTDAYRVRFRGGEDAEVSVRGDGDKDLDLYVHDLNPAIWFVETPTALTRSIVVGRTYGLARFLSRSRIWVRVYNRYRIASNSGRYGQPDALVLASQSN